MNIIDKAIGIFNPQKALNREVARKRLDILASYSNYGANRTKKNMIGWQTRSQSPDDDIVKNIPLLRERSRDLFSGGATLATGAIKTISTNVVGAGLRPNAQIDFEFLGLTDDEADQWELQAEREFRLWAENPNCDATRLNNFYEMQYLAFMSVLLSGDVFATLPIIPRPNSIYDLRVELIEADFVCNPTKIDSTKDILEGVEVGEWGDPLAYHIAKYHPKSSKAMKNEWKRIPAYGAKSGRRNVLHLLTMERPNQRRGVPLLSPVVETLKQLGRYTDAELTAAVISGMFSVFIKTEDPQNPLGESSIPYDQQIDSNDENSYEMGAGAIMALEPNQSIEIANPGRPNTAFDGFITSLARQVGVALELPYELLIKHFTASYSASRAALLEAWKMFRMKRVWLSSNFCQPIYEEWLTEAILKGRIQAKGFFDDPAIRQAWCGVEWVGPSQGQIDPVKEANAAAIRVEQGFSTREREAMELTGGNFSTINKIRIKEERLRRDGELVTDNNGLPIGTAEDIANKNVNIANNEVQAKLKLIEGLSNI